MARLRPEGTGILKPIAEGRNADTRMADAPVAVTCHPRVDFTS